MSSIFKECDIRGIYPEEINENLARKIGKAFAFFFEPQSVIVVGGDVRLSTPPLKKALIEGLVVGGLKVIDVGIVPTPLFYFIVETTAASGGLMVTASHNPPQYNGIKLAFGKMPPRPEDIQKIAKLVTEGKNLKRAKGELLATNEDWEKLYFSYLLERLPAPARPLKMVVDCGNGCYSGIATRFLRGFGHQVIELFCDRNGAFPNRSPNPALPQNLQKLSEMVRSHRADLGIAFDGDGDRVVFVDEQGRFVQAEHSMIFFIRNFVPSGSAFVYDLKCSNIVPQELEKKNCHPLPERSGHAYIKRRLIEEGAFMGGEISGHYFFGNLGRDDGLYAAALFSALLSRQETLLSEVLALYPEPHVTPDIRIPRDLEEHLVEKILETISSSEAELITIDGVKALWSDGWAMLRNSVTEPVYTLRFEATSPEHLRELVHRFLFKFPKVEKVVLEKIYST